jgi:hypothetical protein
MAEVAGSEASEAASREQQLYHLKNLHVKTILKESHCSPVQQLVFNAIDADKENLFATVGGNQATIYDDQHFGQYLDVAAQVRRSFRSLVPASNSVANPHFEGHVH